MKTTQLYRFDEDYTLQRRFLLQSYIRAMVKIPIILERSFALQRFLEINKTRLNSRAGSEDRSSTQESVDGARVSFFDEVDQRSDEDQ